MGTPSKRADGSTPSLRAAARHPAVPGMKGETMRIAFCPRGKHPGGYGDCIKGPGHSGPHRDNQPGRNTWTDDDALGIMVQRAAYRADSILARIPTI
jgi:hypothetical protein